MVTFSHLALGIKYPPPEPVKFNAFNSSCSSLKTQKKKISFTIQFQKKIQILTKPRTSCIFTNTWHAYLNKLFHYDKGF